MGLSCSLQVSYAVEALIFLALERFCFRPLLLRFFREFDFVDFTIWVTSCY